MNLRANAQARRSPWAVLRTGACATPPAPVLDRHTARDGTRLELRTLQAGDQPALQRLIRGLSGASYRMRFHVATGAAVPPDVEPLAITDALGHGRHTWIWSPRGRRDEITAEVCVVAGI